MQAQSVHYAEKQFIEHNKVLRTAQAIELGIQPRTLYKMRDAGRIIQLERGLYKLAGAVDLNNPEIVIATAKTPKAVVCLISALSLHNLTTEIPHAVYLALPAHYKRPKLQTPETRYFNFSPASYLAGQETIVLDGLDVKIYDKAKTVADCFKFRNKIGLSVATEALRSYFEQSADLSKLMAYARINRVANVMRPYIEALI